MPDGRLVGRNYYRLQPHIYSDSQLQELVLAAAKLKPTYHLRPMTYSTLFGLLASTGLRVSEALHLDKDHVDLARGILRIAQTKFRKSRLVPLHATAAQALRRYARERDRDPSARNSRAFFVGQRGEPLPYPTVQGVFARLRDQLGWRSNGMLPKPRMHDMRHSFACRRLLRWYQQGVDVDHAIAALSTYRGHAFRRTATNHEPNRRVTGEQYMNSGRESWHGLMGELCICPDACSAVIVAASRSVYWEIGS